MKLEVTVPVNPDAENIAQSLADALLRIAQSVAQYDITSASLIGGTTRDDEGKAVGTWHLQ